MKSLDVLIKDRLVSERQIDGQTDGHWTIAYAVLALSTVDTNQLQGKREWR